MVRAAVFLSVVALALFAPAAGQTGKAGSAEDRLASLDAHRKEMVAKADLKGLEALSAPGLTINAPTDRILSHDQFFAMMRSGRIAAEAFERQVESVTIQGDVGVVMGSELFTPTAQSELGKNYGAVPLKRRYTNVYVRDRGEWRWFARQAAVIGTAGTTGR